MKEVTVKGMPAWRLLLAFLALAHCTMPLMINGDISSSKLLQKPCAKSMYKLITSIFLFAPALKTKKKRHFAEIPICSWALGF